MCRVTRELVVIIYVTWTDIIVSVTQGQQLSQPGHHSQGLSAGVMHRFILKLRETRPSIIWLGKSHYGCATVNGWVKN